MVENEAIYVYFGLSSYIPFLQAPALYDERTLLYFIMPTFERVICL